MLDAKALWEHLGQVKGRFRFHSPSKHGPPRPQRLLSLRKLKRFLAALSDVRRSLNFQLVLELLEPRCLLTTPVFADNLYPVSESSPNGWAIATLVATDADVTHTLTYTVLSGNETGAFALNAGTGSLTVANAALLNATTTPWYYLTVRATDNGTPALSDTAVITIQVAASSLVAQYTFNDSANPGRDVLGGYNATLVNGPDWNAAGRLGGAIFMDGANDYLATTNMRAKFTNSVSIGAWFYATAGGVIIDESGTTVPNNGVWRDSQIEILNSGQVKVRVWNLGSVSLGVTTLNAWHHALVRYNGATSTLDGFLDGVEAATDVVGAKQWPAALYYLFGATDGTNLGDGTYFNGKLDDVRIYNRALTNAEAQALGGSQAPTNLTLSNTTLAENSANGTVLGTLTTTDGNAADVFTYSMLDDAGGRFALYGPEVRVANGSLLDYESTTSHNIQIQVTDLGGNTLTRTFTVNLTNLNDNTPIVANPQADHATAEDFVYTYQVPANTFSDADGDVLTYTATLADDSPLPGWLTFTPATRIFSGTPLREDVGSLSLKVTASDGVHSTTDVFALTITLTNEPPTAANQTLTMNEDTSHTFASGEFGFSDIDAGDTLTQIKITQLPLAGSFQLGGVDVTLNQVITTANIANLTFAPASNANGNSYATFTFQVHDGTVYSVASYTMTVDVTQVNDPPIANSGGPYDISEGQGLVLHGEGSTDPEGQLLSYAWDLDNDGLYDDAVAATPTLSGPVLKGLGLTPGVHTFSLLVIDDQAVSDVVATTVTITNLPPIANIGGLYSIHEGQCLTLDGANSWDPGQSVLSYRWDLNHDGVYGDVTGANATLSWSQLALWGITDNGSYTLGLQVTDPQGLSDSQTALLVVDNVAPVFTTLAIVSPIDENTATTLTGTVLDYGADTLTLAVNWGDGHLDTTALALHSFTLTHTYTAEAPPASYRVLVTLADDDGGATTTEHTVVINALNDPPVISGFTKTADEDTVLAFAASDFTGAFADPDGDALHHITLLSLPEHGMLAITQGVVAIGQEILTAQLDTLTFTPEADWNGTTSFSWTASDGVITALSPTQAHLFITPVNDSPVVTDWNLHGDIVAQGDDMIITGTITDVDNAHIHVDIYWDRDHNGLIDPQQDLLLKQQDFDASDITLDLPTEALPYGAHRLLVVATDGDQMIGTPRDFEVIVAHALPFTKNQPVQFTNAQGERLQISLTGPGQGVVLLPGDDGVDNAVINVIGTTRKSTLRITTAPHTAATLTGTLTVSADQLGSILAPHLTLNGDLTCTGDLRRLRLAGLQNSHTLIESSAVPLTARLGLAQDVQFTTTGRIASLQAASWQDTDSQPDTLTAPSLGKLKITGNRKTQNQGDFAADLTLTGDTSPQVLNAARIHGAIVGSTWQLLGKAGRITSGGVLQSHIHCQDDLGMLSTTGMEDSSILIGVKPLIDTPDSLDDFDRPAALHTLRVGNGPLKNIFIAAWSLEQVMLRNLDFLSSTAPSTLVTNHITTLQQIPLGIFRTYHHLDTPQTILTKGNPLLVIL